MNTVINALENLIRECESSKEDYYEENGNRTDSHTMWLVGQIDAYKTAIKTIKEGK